jgi:hypothetical protein
VYFEEELVVVDSCFTPFLALDKSRGVGRLLGES